MYQTILEDIKGKIARGELKENDPLPTQIELSQLYNTSEITSRRALSELVQAGFIYRIKGKGTFVKGNVDDSGKGTGNPTVTKLYFVYPETRVEVFNHRFFADLFQGISEVSEELELSFALHSVDANYWLPDEPHAAFIIMTHVPDAVEIPMEVLQRWKRERRLMVTVSFHYPHLYIPYVMVDSLTGGYLATQHLLAAGHRRIGIILTGRSLIDMNQEFSLRLQGYKVALEQHRVPFDPDLVVVLEGLHEREKMGEVGLGRLLALDRPPTAIFAGSDYKAIGVLQAAKALQMSVPGDLSVVGYDDVLVAGYMSPPLTTVNQNACKLGRRAVEMIVTDCLDVGPNQILKDEIVPSLVVRESTAEQSK